MKRTVTKAMLDECYQLSTAAERLDDLAHTLGWETFRDVDEHALNELLVDNLARQELIEAVHRCYIDIRKARRHAVVKVKTRKRRCHYCVYYLGTDGHTKSKLLWAYSSEQAAGYLLSGKHRLSPLVTEIIEVIRVN